MDPIDVDEIAEINYSDSAEAESVEVVFKDGTRTSFSGPELRELLPLLNHWTPPTA